MRGIRHRSSVKSIAAILCAVCFLTMSLGSVSRAVAADTFETWPKKTTEPGVEPKPPTDGAAQAGDASGKKAATGLSSGTIGWVAAGAAAILLIAVAAGGGGSTSNH
ncbi:MAG: hypothetical protein HW377_2827 [Actinobacteria bacterium]|nr:hypothetical protein [Actinomycetota bacterium]